MLARFINRLVLAVGHEDPTERKELFDAMWPSLQELHQAGALELGGLAHPLLEALYWFYLRLPSVDSDRVEATLRSWAGKKNLAPDHPLRTDTSVQRILDLARRTRRHSDSRRGR